MVTADGLNRTLRASLCEIERGLFRASYFGVGLRGSIPKNSLQALPIYQVARCAADARAIIEGNARAIGYDMVAWETGFDPLIEG
jgi:hypothetical protein